MIQNCLDFCAKLSHLIWQQYKKMPQNATSGSLVGQNQGLLDQEKVLENVLLLKCFSEGGRSRNVSVW